MITNIRKVLVKRFEFSIVQIFFYIGVFAAISVGIVTIAQWRFNLLDRVEKKIVHWPPYSALTNQAPSQAIQPPPQAQEVLPAAPDLNNTVLNILAVQSHLPDANDLLIGENEDQNYLRSILKIIFPAGTAGLSEEQISLEILRYVTSALALKNDEGSATKILQDGYAICGGRSVSLQALVRLAGIPTRLVNIYGLNKEGGHTMVEVYYDGQWHLYDPTFGLFFYSRPSYDKSGVVASLYDLVTGSTEKWYIFKVVDRPWGEYDASTRSFGVVRAEEDYLLDYYGTPFLVQYRKMFATAFPVAYDANQVISFPVVVDFSRADIFSVGEVDRSARDVLDATASPQTAGKVGNDYLSGTSYRQYVHTWFIKVPSPGFMRIIYYSADHDRPSLLLFPLRGVQVVESVQNGNKAKFLLRISEPEAALQFWAQGIFVVDAVRATWLGPSSDIEK